jgi:hypothetical protein
MARRSYGRLTMRSWRPIALAGFVAVVAALAFPAAGSALDARFIFLTATGPSQTVLTMEAGQYAVWQNQDAVEHTVVFTNGLCSLQIAAGGYGQCSNGFSAYVGTYAYTVDGTTQASVVVVAAGRSITLGARSHRILRHSPLRLHGVLGDWDLSPPGPGTPQPVIVLARHNRYQPFHRIAVVRAKLQRHSTKGAPFGRLVWQLAVRPRRKMIYIAEANSQPSGGQVWQQAWSKPFKVAVRR